MLGRWKSLSTHRGWRGNRGRREIFDRNRPIGPQRAQYFYFNTSGINILAFVVWHLVSRVGKIFVHPSETDYDTEAERFGDNSFTGWAGEKDWQEEAAHPSSSRDIFVDLMDRPGEPLCHANIPRKYHARWPPFVSISSISWNLTLNRWTTKDDSTIPLGLEIFLWIRSLVWRLHFLKINFWIIYLKQFVLICRVYLIRFEDVWERKI